MKNITIIGSGSFGCALAHVFSKNNKVKIWSFTKEETESINNKHECMQLPNIKLDNNIMCYQKYDEAILGSDIIVLVTPSNVFRNTCKEIKNYVSNQQIIIASKGMENDKLLSDVVKEELNIDPIILMGPSFAEEVGTDKPTFVEISNKELISELETNNFKLNYNGDYIGLQVCGALKNVITLASGILEGLKYGVNRLSYIFTEGIKEIKEIGLKLGAKVNTFYGLAGIGDLYGTSFSSKSRNKRAGILLGQGKKLDEIYKEVGQTIEGLDTIKDAKYMIDNYNLDCPLLLSLYEIIYNEKKAESIFE